MLIHTEDISGYTSVILFYGVFFYQTFSASFFPFEHSINLTVLALFSSNGLKVCSQSFDYDCFLRSA